MDRGSGTPPKPITAFLRPVTTRFFNPFSRLFVRWLPGFCILWYRGRRSGKAYRTPMNVFRDGDDWIFALTYGSDVQRVKNVLAAGEAVVEVLTRRVRLAEPELFIDPKRRLMPQPVRSSLASCASASS